jgi:Arc/MetJ-type ribon-helix-helix transcriptional regulator
MPPELEAKIDAWIERQPEPRPSRSEAIRRLIEIGLEAT